MEYTQLNPDYNEAKQIYDRLAKLKTSLYSSTFSHIRIIVIN